MRITITTTGTRGDIQPYVALGLGLQRAGHAVRIATTPRFQEFVGSWGLDFMPMQYIDYSEEPLDKEIWETTETDVEPSCQDDDPGIWAPLRRLEMFPDPLAIVHTYSLRLRSHKDNFLPELYQVCQESDAILFTPNLFQGFDVAEALNVPCFAACVQPLSQTRVFPHIFTPIRWRFGHSNQLRDLSLGGLYNVLTYSLFDQFLWRSTQQPINQWRQETLNLPPLSSWSSPLRRMHYQRIPFLYGYSPAFLPKPADWSDWLHITGYWFLDQPIHWQPSPELVNFLAAGSPPVCIGFGSASPTDGDANTRTELVLEALARTGQRGILLTGWGGLCNTDLPTEVFAIESVPHDWLFPKVSAVVHHGGSGTTAAGLRAGVPSIIIPFDGDQFFWGQQIAALGLGPKPIPQTLLSADWLASAIQTVIHDQALRDRAAAIGQQIRAEDGVARAVELFHHYLNR